ncbi:hypothetical protein Hanom_Chr15g01339611 [Helianthus anomalus]
MIFWNPIPIKVHLSNQNLHRQITCLCFFEGILKPPPQAIRHHIRQRKTVALPLSAATTAAAAVSAIFHLFPTLALKIQNLFSRFDVGSLKDNRFHKN